MTRDEMKMFMQVVVSAYPNFKPANLSMTVNLWTEMLKDYSSEAVMTALKTFICTDTSGFAPSISQIIEKMNVVEELNELTDMEAWALVGRALRDSAYHAQERFDELPPLVKKAVGSPDNLRAWGTAENYSENVAQSQFIRSYQDVLKRKKEIAKLPSNVRQLIQNTERLMISAD